MKVDRDTVANAINGRFKYFAIIKMINLVIN